MNPLTLQPSNILIAGYGREGQSTHRFLSAEYPESRITVAHDDNELETLLRQGTFFDWVVKSPGIPMSRLRPYVEPEHITSQTDIFLQRYAAQTIGVTGTKGKSTTTALIAHILGHALHRPVLLAGNMGIPLLDIVPQITDDTLIVAELSCHQLQGIRRAPHIGVLLNLYQEHLDHYDSYRDYQMAKMQIMLRQQSGDCCYYCADSPDLQDMVSEQRPAMRGEVKAYHMQEAMADASWQWPTALAGNHNRSNIYVATQVARHLGVPDADCQTAVTSFQGLPHRLQRVGIFRGITFYNDSISTIPEATIAALKALPDVETLILGGYDRGIDYSPLIDYLTTHPVNNIVWVGAAGRRMADRLEGNGRGAFFRCDDYAQIVAWCYQHTTPGHSCLLSPAAASYDAFKNFEQRGDTFCHWVKTLGKE